MTWRYDGTLEVAPDDCRGPDGVGNAAHAHVYQHRLFLK